MMDFFTFRYPLAFSTYEFVLAFLPLSIAGYGLAARIGGRELVIKYLVAISFVFYGLFGLNLLAILAGSVVANFYVARAIITRRGEASSRTLMLAGIGLNLAALGYLKYVNFLAGLFIHSSASHTLNVVGVSFFTFIQIGYLIDAYNGQVNRHEFARYALFSSFFPCVTAGPLVLQREFMGQLENAADKALDPRRLAAAFTIFGFGLFKKVVLADAIAPFAKSVFDTAALTHAVDPATAWIGALCYALQLYFDFSGYSDMAVGLGLMFGIKLPLNFNSPFKTSNISDFWRNWHMTMTRFFTNYIYTGLAMKGMRRAMTQRMGAVPKFLFTAAIPSIVTFLVAGIWHGAGWTFVAYGLLHGCAIASYLAWREFSSVRLPVPVAWALTMMVVVFGLVIFNAPDMSTASAMIASMLNLAGAEAPAIAGFDAARALSFIVVYGAITVLMPNTQQILHLEWPTSDNKPGDAAMFAGLLAWRPKMSSAFVTAGIYAIALTSIGSGTSFLYYQF